MFVPGSSSKITEQNLKGTDIDSDNLKLRYTLTKDPPSGKLLLLSNNGQQDKVSVKGPVNSFTQDDVNKGEQCTVYYSCFEFTWSFVTTICPT